MPAMSKMSNLKPQRLWASPKDLVVGARRSRGDPVLTRKRNLHWLYETTVEGCSSHLMTARLCSLQH